MPIKRRCVPIHYILLAVDGSAQASKAVTAALWMAGINGARLTVLYLIDSGWRNLLGDEWISSEGSRMRFFRYMERDRAEGGRRVLDDIAKRCNDSGLWVNTMIKTGRPEEIVISSARDMGPFDLIVLPHPSGRNEEGAAKLNIEKIARALAVPILIGPP